MFIKEGEQGNEKDSKASARSRMHNYKTISLKALGITTTALVMSCWRLLPRVPPLYPSQTGYV